MNEIDVNSRDYSFESIEEDPRITRTTKEFFITMGTYIVYGILMIANLFILGPHSAPAAEEGCKKAWAHCHVLGFPLWIFILILLLVGMIATVELICSFVYRDMDLTAAKDREAE